MLNAKISSGILLRLKAPSCCYCFCICLDWPCDSLKGRSSCGSVPISAWSSWVKLPFRQGVDCLFGRRGRLTVWQDFFPHGGDIACMREGCSGGFFTRGQFWPTGIVIASVCVCVCNFKLVCGITHRPFKLGSTNLNPKWKTFLGRLIKLDFPGQI